MEMYRRNLPDDKARHKLQRLARRLLAVADQLGHVAPLENEEILAGQIPKKLVCCANAECCGPVDL
jgi:hypothetical protein